MKTNDNEDERRRVIAQLQEVVRRRQVASESGKDPEAEFALRAKRADAPAGPADLGGRQGNSQKAAPDGRVPRPTPPRQGRDSEIKRFGPPGGCREMASADVLAEGAEAAPPPGAARPDPMLNGRNYGGKPENLLRKLEEEFSTSVVASAAVKPRRYLLGAAAITIILGLVGLAASIAFQNPTPSVGETARVTELETPKLEQEEIQIEAAPQDASAEAQQSSTPMDKVEDTSEEPRPRESSPSASADSRSATEVHNAAIASPRLQVQDPLAQAIKNFNAPALPTGAFSAQDPPQTPAAEPTKETPGEPGKIAHARDETPVESLTGSSQSPPKTAPLPPRRALDASAERPRTKAAEGKQKGGAPPQETLHTAGGAEATPPSEDIVQRALDSLINGWERAP